MKTLTRTILTMLLLIAFSPVADLHHGAKLDVPNPPWCPPGVVCN